LRAGSPALAGECQRVPRQRDLRPAFCRDDYLDDIDADRRAGLFQQPQPGVCAADESILLLRVHRIGGSAEAIGGARFHFHKDQRLPVAADEIDLAAIVRAKVPVQHLVPAAPQPARGKPLPVASQPQVRGLRLRGGGVAPPPGEKCGDVLGKGHGV
jgi:hypothetical protein